MTTQGEGKEQLREANQQRSEMWSLNDMKLLLLAQVVDQGSPRVAGFPFSETYRWDEGKWWVCRVQGLSQEKGERVDEWAAWSWPHIYAGNQA